MTGRGTIPEISDESGDPRGGPGRVGGPSRKSETDRGTLPEVREGLGTLGEVRYISGDPHRGLGRFGDSPGGLERDGDPSRGSGQV